jgi:hypothetical protein
MKYTSKRVDKNQRKSKRNIKTHIEMDLSQTGGGYGTITLPPGVMTITGFDSLDHVVVEDTNVNFKYKIHINENTQNLILIDIEKIGKNNKNMINMINKFYNIPSKFTLKGATSNGFDTKDLKKLREEIKNIPVFDSTSNKYPRYEFTLKTIKFKIATTEHGINISNNILNDATLKKNILNYFKNFKVIQSPPVPITSSVPPPAPSVPITSSVPSTATPITPTHILDIQKIIPGAKFEGTKLLSKTTIVTDGKGGYYATETTYDVKC